MVDWTKSIHMGHCFLSFFFMVSAHVVHIQICPHGTQAIVLGASQHIGHLVFRSSVSSSVGVVLSFSSMAIDFYKSYEGMYISIRRCDIHDKKVYITRFLVSRCISISSWLCTVLHSSMLWMDSTVSSNVAKGIVAFGESDEESLFWLSITLGIVVIFCGLGLGLTTSLFLTLVTSW